ncbi:MaoC family dehydratase [uncultured Desulfosarcina sp.]|uniref:MaoC family dehydratase n=1 Tax=uncultured Desulfosarcina sp. TaxID=218289 RepID=UPI0029C8A79C|nr:MaoC family dehydratase [uncultured Desulfosarcina sp.]
MIGKTFDQLNIGDSDRFSKTVTDADIYLFAGVTGDLNPAHIDEAYAQGTFFKTRIAHGMLSAGFISAVIGTRLPGPGTVYMRQTLEFLSPVRIGDTVTATVEVIEKMADKKRVRLKTTCVNQEGTKVLDGEALVSPPRPPKKS